MATHRPLVMIDGRVKELPVGDTLLGAVRYARFLLSDGTSQVNIATDGTGGIPLLLADGATAISLPLEAEAIPFLLADGATRGDIPTFDTI